MKFIFITNLPDMANYAFVNGAERIMVDLEVNGKVERQKCRNTLISNHSFGDLEKIKEKNSKIQLVCRINPFFDGTKSEVENAISRGADYIMLPMFRSNSEVEMVYHIIRGRAKLILLFETPQSIIRVHEIAAARHFDEAHIGLNDLSLAFGIDFMFELLGSGIIDFIADSFNTFNVPFGLGGIAKYGEGIARSELVMSEHVRLGSSSVILSRSFHEYSGSLGEMINKIDFKKEIDLLKQCEANFIQDNKSHVRTE
jgi:hypothetical protein